ncbi:hypothetical protein [Streptomyces sp. S.PB5]|uniref:hypothetical protein n=1 Tax=Streptomyces sp. S.PB5 TaxID=3020844 RepID=UPI0025AEFF7D|nr:hypothetical protein [Streptomyces sp. S.PB5]MDN3029005.1 hypothetical protein [Streptomyces sp. S.PB5]
MRTRVLAEDPERVWLAVSGTLGPTTGPRLRQELRARADGKRRAFFLDLTELRCGDGLQDDAVRQLFTLGPEARFHLIGAADEIRTSVANDPRFTFHSTLESAWGLWR